MNIHEPAPAEQGPLAGPEPAADATGHLAPDAWLCSALLRAAEQHQVPLPDAIAATEQVLYQLGVMVQDGTLPDPTHHLDRLRLFVAGFAAGAAAAGGAR